MRSIFSVGLSNADEELDMYSNARAHRLHIPRVSVRLDVLHLDTIEIFFISHGLGVIIPVRLDLSANSRACFTASLPERRSNRYLPDGDFWSQNKGSKQQERTQSW